MYAHTHTHKHTYAHTHIHIHTDILESFKSIKSTARVTLGAMCVVADVHWSYNARACVHIRVCICMCAFLFDACHACEHTYQRINTLVNGVESCINIVVTQTRYLLPKD